MDRIGSLKGKLDPKELTYSKVLNLPEDLSPCDENPKYYFPPNENESPRNKVKEKRRILDTLIKIESHNYFTISKYILILLLFVASLYLSYLAHFYKHLNRNAPNSTFCMSKNEKYESNFDAEWSSRGKKVTEDFMEFIKSDKWKYFKQLEGYSGYVMDGGDIYKANGTYKGVNPPDVLKLFYFGFEQWPEWDYLVKNATIFRSINNRQTMFGYYKEGFFGVKRDFLAIGHYEELEKDTFAIGLNSVQLGGIDEVPNDAVRGFMKNSGMFIKPSKEKNCTDFEIAFNLDLKLDWLPFRDTIMIKYIEKKVEAIGVKIQKDILNKQ